MIGKRYAMEVVSEFKDNIVEDILHWGKLYFEDTPDDWKNMIRFHLDNTLAILGNDYELTDVEEYRGQVSCFTLIKKGYGERGAQIHYTNKDIEKEMRFSTINNGCNVSLIVKSESSGDMGCLDFYYKKRIDSHCNDNPIKVILGDYI